MGKREGARPRLGTLAATSKRAEGGEGEEAAKAGIAAPRNPPRLVGSRVRLYDSRQPEA